VKANGNYRFTNLWTGYIKASTTGYWEFQMEKDVDAYVTMWADIPAKKNGLCFTGALAAAPTSGNFLVRAWHNGKYASSGRVYMEQGVFYPVRIQYSNDGNNSRKFNGIRAGFATSATGTLTWANTKQQSGKMEFMHYKEGGGCWAANGVRDSTSNTYINKYGFKICTSSSDPHLPLFPSGERMPVQRLGPCPDQGMRFTIRVQS
jgi:hypothetical protein